MSLTKLLGKLITPYYSGCLVLEATSASLGACSVAGV